MSFCSIDLNSTKVKEFINSLSDLNMSEARIKNLINLWRNKTRNYDELPTKEDFVSLVINAIPESNQKLLETALKLVKEDGLKALTNSYQNLSFEEIIKIKTMFNSKEDNSFTRNYYEDELLFLNNRNLETKKTFKGNPKDAIQQFKDEVSRILLEYHTAHHYDGGYIQKPIKNVLSKDAYFDYIKTLSNSIIEKLEKEGFEINITPYEEYPATMGTFILGKQINLIYNPKLVFIEDKRLDYIIAHELVHSITSGAINSYKTSLETPEIKAFTENIWNIIVDLYENKKFYWDFGINIESVEGNELSYIKEFIANVMTDPSLQKALASIKIKNTNQTLWDKFINAVKSFLSEYLGIDIQDSYLEKIMNEISAFVELNPISAGIPIQIDNISNNKKGKTSRSISPTLEGAAVQAAASYYATASKDATGVLPVKFWFNNNHYLGFLDIETATLVHYYRIPHSLFTEGSLKIPTGNLGKTFKTSQQRQDRVLLISRLFSQIVNKKVGSEADSKTRNNYKLNNALSILGIIKNQLLHPSSIKENDPNKEYKTIEFQKIQDNWYLLLEEVADQLLVSEGIKLDFIEKKVSNDVKFNDDNDDATNEGDYSDTENTEVVYKDGWMIKARLIPLRDSLSKEVRKVISEVPKINKLGEYEKDDLGFYRNLSADYVHTVLLDTLSKITTSDDFFPALEELSKSKIWVKEIIKKLQGDEKLQALFYRDLVKEFVPYWIEYTTEKDGKITYKTKQVNKSASHYYLLNDWRDNFESGTRFTKDSVYDDFGKIVPKNGTIGKEKIEKFKDHIKKQTNPNDYLTKDSTVNAVEELLNSVGISATKDEIIEYLGLNLGKTAEYAPLENLLDNLYNIFKGVSEVSENKIDSYDLLNENNGAYNKIAKQFNIIPQGAIIPNFKEAGKSYQSYSPQSYMGRLLNKIKYSTEERFKEFIDNEYGQYNFFKTISNGKERWWNDWISKLVSDKKYRNLLDRKVVLTSDRKEFDNQDEKYYMRSILTEYFSGGKEDAWYYCPLLADAPSSEFFKFVKYVDGMVVDGNIIDDYKDYIADKMTDTVLQEIQRINLVINRYNNGNIQPIANFDIVEGQPNAASFKFFPSLNDYKIEGFNFIDYVNNRIRDGKNVRSIIKETIKNIQNEEFNKFISTIQQQGVLEGLNYTNSQLEEFFWNNAHAQIQIIEILTTDLGFYKNLNDFQKRFKEVYAQTQRLYTNVEGGNKYQRVLYLTDQEIISISYREIEELLTDYYKNDKESLNKILSKFKEVNVTDAQAYRPLSSYRSIMKMSGQWTYELEKAYNNFVNNTYKPEDFDVVLQTIKPFVFTQMGVPSGLKDGKNIKMPTQHKNSESVLLAIYDVIAGPNNTSPKLKALHQFMEDNKIDVVMFNSAVKAGCQGPIDLNNIEDNDYDGTYQALTDNALIDGLDNPEVIHTYSTEDYGIQVETPEHMFDSESLIGSQLRKLIMADLPENYTLKVGNKEFKSREELWRHYNSIMTSLFEEGFKEVYNELSTKEGVERLLQKQMKGNSRYTDEMRKACTLTTDEYGSVDFVTPLFDPIQSERIENLLCSIVKTAVIKQKTKGAKAIQVSNFGYHKDLMLRFKDQNNNLIFTESEWDGNTKGLSKQEIKLLNKLKIQYNNSYSNYRNSAKSTSVAYYEAYLPAYTKDLFGNINTIEGTHEIDINDIPVELRECIGYRIPTENKLSMQPIRIKGFLPHQEGAKIALPADITTIVGADFDVDGIFLMLPETEVIKYNKSAAREAFRMSDESFESTKENFENWYKEHKKDFKYDKPIIKRISYDYSKQANENTTEQKANGLIDLFYAILNSKEVAPQILKPGNFDEASRVGKICDLLKEVSYDDLAKSLEIEVKDLPKKLETLSLKNVKKLLAEYSKPLNPISPTTQTYFHNQNAVGGKMIGMYANSSVHNALAQYTDLALKTPLNFLGTTYQSLHNQLGKFNQRISDNIGQFSAASVDNVKDPTLSSLNQNTFTGNVTSLLLRLGAPIFEIGMFMNQPIVKQITTAVLNKPTNISINQVFDNIKKTYLESIGASRIEDVKLPDVVIEDLIKNISPNKSANYNFKQLAVFDLFERLYKLGTQLGNIVRNNRGDTSNGSIDSTVLSNIAREQELIHLDTPDIIYNNIINTSSLTDDALDLYDDNYEDTSNIPMLNVATIAGIGGVNAIMQQYFPQNNTQVQSMFSELSNIVGNLNRYNTKVYDRAYKDYMTYWLAELPSLNKTTIKGTTYYGKDLINYFFNNFPKEFTSMKDSIEELRNNNFIKNIIEDNRSLPITILKFKNTGNLSKQMKEAYSKDWEMLLNSPNEEVRNLGITLFQYCLYIGGLYYNGQTFIHLAPLSIRQQIEGYNKRLKELMIRDNSTYEFVNQFALNHLYNNTICPECNEASNYFNNVEPNGSLDLDLSNEGIKTAIKADTLKTQGVKLYYPKQYIKTKHDDNYRYWKVQNNEEATNPIVTYNEVYPLGYKGKLVEYLPGVEFFETLIPKNSKVNTSPESTSEYSGIENIEVSWELQTISEDLGQIENYIPKEDFIDANNQKICD